MKKIITNILPEKVMDMLRTIRGPNDLELPHSERVRKWGHRRYIGGTAPENWYGIGKRQYHFLVSNGLESKHQFLDVACGGLRLGQYLIPMLDTGNYFGLEAEPALIEAGLKSELLFDVVSQKKPSFASNYDFDLSFCKAYDYAIAQSLFTHLILEDITKCFDAMSKIANKESQFFFTFFEGDEAENKFDVSHAHRNWYYRYDTLASVAEKCGFECRYIGDWGHERNQMIAVATLKA